MLLQKELKVTKTDHVYRSIYNCSVLFLRQHHQVWLVFADLSLHLWKTFAFGYKNGQLSLDGLLQHRGKVQVFHMMFTPTFNFLFSKQTRNVKSITSFVPEGKFCFQKTERKRLSWTSVNWSRWAAWSTQINRIKRIAKVLLFIWNGLPLKDEWERKKPEGKCPIDCVLYRGLVL